MKKHRTTGKRILALLLALMMLALLPLTAFAGQEAVDKDETVYVNADACGRPIKITVNEVLKKQKGDQIADSTDLNQIENVKGDETFTKGSDGSLFWENLGQDITYQGQTDKELPVSMTISYYLNGRKVSPEDLSGQSGSLRVRFDYENKKKVRVNVDGEEKEIFAPFTVITGMILDSDHYANVEAKNGKIVSDGKRIMVIGLAFPGLKESLSLESYEETADVELPSYVEVEADVEEYKQFFTASIVTTGLMEDMELDELDSADELKEDMDRLTDASDRLLDGTKELSEGLDTWYSSFGDYKDGVKKADDGVQSLKAGLAALDQKKNDVKAGAMTIGEGLKALREGGLTLKDGINSYTVGVAALETGIHKADQGVDDLCGGADQLLAGVQTYTKGLSSLENGLDQLQTGLSKTMNGDVKAMTGKADAAAKKLSQDADQLSKSMKTMEAGLSDLAKLSTKLEQLKSGLVDAEAALTKIKEANSSSRNLVKGIDEKATAEARKQAGAEADRSRQEGLKALESALSDLDLSDSQKAALKTAFADAYNYKEEKISIHAAGESGLEEVLEKEAAGLDQVIASLHGAVEGLVIPELPDLSTLRPLLEDMAKQADILHTFGSDVSDLTSGLSSLTQAVKELDDGAHALASKNDALCGGAAALDKGLADLKQGMGELGDGVVLLNKNSSVLKGGALALVDGAGQLVEGNETLVKGIQTFNEGISLVSSGSGDLRKGTQKLVEASGLLADGTKSLSQGGHSLLDGMEEFNRDGIEKLADLAGDDLKQVITNVKAVHQADSSYQSFGGKAAHQKGRVRFIIETDN